MVALVATKVVELTAMIVKLTVMIVTPTKKVVKLIATKK